MEFCAYYFSSIDTKNMRYKYAGGILFIMWIGIHTICGSETTNCSRISPPNMNTYWDHVQSCSPCLAAEGCGYCHSTLSCQEGDVIGPFSGPMCPDWLTEDDECPSQPECVGLDNCETCATAAECAWCASDSTCMTIEATYTSSCRGTVFDTPCPASFIGGK